MRDPRRGHRRVRPDARSQARALVRELPNLVKLLYRLLRDHRVPTLEKVLFGGALAYVLMPADLMPDFLGFFGLVDDLYLVGLALGRLLANTGDTILLQHWDGNAHALGYLIEGVEQLGEMLPSPVRRILHRTAEES